LSDGEFACAALAAGLFLGALFFGGLWWTLKRGITAKNPALWFAVSLLLRLSVCLAGFYAVSASGWRSLLVSLLGFIIARVAVTRFTARAIATSHAP
jgi:F1F0 ATPase subunit 2